MTVAIWGSCVTRDTFELGGRWDEPLSYHARSSWISQAAPVPVSPVPVPGGAGFAERMVREDLTKSILAESVAAAPDLVIFDLIDERFDVVESAGSRFSVNDYYPRLDLEAALRATAERTVAFRDEERDELFTDAVRTLADEWLAALPTARFALHRAWYTARSTDPENHPFYASAPLQVRWANQRLARHYEALHQAFGSRLHVVEPDSGLHLVGDPGHKWGLAHYHYVPSYYEECLSQIRGIHEGAPSEPRPVVIPTPEQSGGAADEPGAPPSAVVSKERRLLPRLRSLRRR